LTETDYARFGEPLQTTLDALPREYLGYRWQDQRKSTSGVIEVGEYIKSIVGCESPPEEASDWLHIPEEYLFEITPKRVFYDAKGEVTKRFEAFTRYPEDVWKKRLSASLAWLWEWGIKHLPRSERRGDTVTATMYWCKFTIYAMKVTFLLNCRYVPYHKWLYREFLKLPEIVQEVAPLVEEGFQILDGKGQVASQIEEIFKDYLRQLGYQPVVSRSKANRVIAYPENELLNYAKVVRESITTREIRDLKLYLEIYPPPWKATWTWIHSAL